MLFVLNNGQSSAHKHILIHNMVAVNSRARVPLYCHDNKNTPFPRFHGQQCRSSYVTSVVITCAEVSFSLAIHFTKCFPLQTLWHVQYSLPVPLSHHSYFFDELKKHGNNYSRTKSIYRQVNRGLFWRRKCNNDTNVRPIFSDQVGPK